MTGEAPCSRGDSRTDFSASAHECCQKRRLGSAARAGVPPVPPPPADAGSLQESDLASHPASIKELLERHQREASCVSCHVRMDPFGFALEGFDVIGKKRTRYANGLPVEEDGILRDGTPIVGYPGIRQYFKGHIDLFYRNYCRRIDRLRFGPR